MHCGNAFSLQNTALKSSFRKAYRNSSHVGQSQTLSLVLLWRLCFNTLPSYEALLPRLDDIVVGRALRPQRPGFLLKWFLGICIGRGHSGSLLGIQICEKRFLLEAVPVVDPVNGSADLKVEEN